MHGTSKCNVLECLVFCIRKTHAHCMDPVTTLHAILILVITANRQYNIGLAAWLTYLFPNCFYDCLFEIGLLFWRCCKCTHLFSCQQTFIDATSCDTFFSQRRPRSKLLTCADNVSGPKVWFPFFSNMYNSRYAWSCVTHNMDFLKTVHPSRGVVPLFFLSLIFSLGEKKQLFKY